MIRKHCNTVERASVDEAYLDITDIVNERLSTIDISPKKLISLLANTYIVGYSEIGKNNEGNIPITDRFYSFLQISNVDIIKCILYHPRGKKSWSGNLDNELF